MSAEAFSDPAFTVALALAVGMAAQALARHLRLPGIVLLLAAGAVLGPDGVGWVQPDDLGPALETLIGFAVAIILFEGGLNLNLSRLRKQAKGIRRLVTWGALITGFGGAVASHLALRWDWRLSALFGSLVIVTGPTVVTPLIRRIRLRPRVATILEAEGVLIDPIGAILAIVTLEFVLHPSALHFGSGLLNLVQGLGLGSLLGVLGGVLVAAALRSRYLLPEGLENIVALAAALLLYQISDSLVPESGMMAVTVAGLVVGGSRSHALRELREFKGQLTVLFIGMLFVLLAASVRLSEVRSLGWPGLAVVAVLIFAVRPVEVAACMAGTDLSWRERLFLAWLAPRGIVAAAVASLFAGVLTEAGIPGGAAFQAMIFLVIAVTVVVQGLSGGLVARWLGLRRPLDNGYALLGAGPLPRCLAALLRQFGDEVILIDTSEEACELARAEGLSVIYGSGASETVQLRAELESRAGAVALTANEEANFIFIQAARQVHQVPRAWIALRKDRMGIRRRQIAALGAHLMFGEPRRVERWSVLLTRQEAHLSIWTHAPEWPPGDAAASQQGAALEWPTASLPLLAEREGRPRLIDETYEPRRGDRLHLLVQDSGADEVRHQLARLGWESEPLAGQRKSQ